VLVDWEVDDSAGVKVTVCVGGSEVIDAVVHVPMDVVELIF